MLTTAARAAAIVVCLSIAGCITPHGVQVMNQTGRVLTVEYLHVHKDGSTSAYSTAVLAPDGQLKHHPPSPEGFQAERVRLAVADAPDEIGHSLVLHIPEGRTRDFDIQYVSGRLVAREHRKGRDHTRTGEPDFGK